MAHITRRTALITGACAALMPARALASTAFVSAVQVRKGARRLELISDGRVVRAYPVFRPEALRGGREDAGGGVRHRQAPLALLLLPLPGPQLPHDEGGRRRPAGGALRWIEHLRPRPAERRQPPLGGGLDAGMRGALERGYAGGVLRGARGLPHPHLRVREGAPGRPVPIRSPRDQWGWASRPARGRSSPHRRACGAAAPWRPRR